MESYYIFMPQDQMCGLNCDYYQDDPVVFNAINLDYVMDIANDILHLLWDDLLDCVKDDHLELSWSRDISQWTLEAEIVRYKYDKIKHLSRCDIGQEVYLNTINNLKDLVSITILNVDEYNDYREYYKDLFSDYYVSPVMDKLPIKNYIKDES